MLLAAGTDPSAADDILLGDTMGELLLLLGTATVAVVGGSLVAQGGRRVTPGPAAGTGGEVALERHAARPGQGLVEVSEVSQDEFESSQREWVATVSEANLPPDTHN